MDLTQNYALSRMIATQGMVLLKNDAGVLPLRPQDRIGLVGRECLSLIESGGGAAFVQCEYIRSLVEGLQEKQAEEKLLLDASSVLEAQEQVPYTVEALNELAKRTDKVILTVKRYGTEGNDRQVGFNTRKTMEEGVYQGETNENVISDYETQVGYFYLSRREQALLDAIEQSQLQSVIVLLNISSIVDLSWILRYSKIKAVLLTYLPGMECGTSIADVLCGDVNPSGKLVDTVALDYEDYPTAKVYDVDPLRAEYPEGIFVGYRYFETYAKDRVQYPFGFGLSYTTFRYESPALAEVGDMLQASVTVRNTGNVPGREVVQVYAEAPRSALEKPALELRGFEKTKLLQPGEEVRITVEIPIRSLASFDAEGVTGCPAAWVLERGEYAISVGSSCRERLACGVYTVPATRVAEQLSIRFDGRPYEMPADDWEQPSVEKGISLYDVAEGNASLYDFITQLSVDELMELTRGQPSEFPSGCSGVGKLKHRGVPNPQMADGPVGIRRSTNATCFPCSTLLACSWDPEIQFAMGEALGQEGTATGVDILLAPGLNIHRDPRCGRNFEYMSEDPLISGKTAAAVVRGAKKEHFCMTLKHFAANNCEYGRFFSNSVLDERTLRELYLRGFEIAVKESEPDFVMSSYNQINGVHSSANAQLLRGVLRDEWGFKGAVMTDWRNVVPMDGEILAGNNLKMPFGYPEEEALVRQGYEEGRISLTILRENARCVLQSVMQTDRFRKKNFGIVHKLQEGILEIPALAVDGISSTRVRQELREDGSWYLCQLNKDIRAQRTYVLYTIDVPQTGTYRVSAEYSTDCPVMEIWYENARGERLATVNCSGKCGKAWHAAEAVITLEQGENTLKVIFADEPDREYVLRKYEYAQNNLFNIPSLDIRLSGLQIQKA